MTPASWNTQLTWTPARYQSHWQHKAASLCAFLSSMVRCDSTSMSTHTFLTEGELTYISGLLTHWSMIIPVLVDPGGPLWWALRAVLQGEDGAQYPGVEPAPRLHPGRAQGGREGGGGCPRWLEGGPHWEILQSHPDDRQGAAAAHWCEWHRDAYNSFHQHNYLGNNILVKDLVFLYFIKATHKMPLGL